MSKYDQYFRQQPSPKDDDETLRAALDGDEIQAIERAGMQGFAVPAGAMDALLNALPETLPAGIREAFEVGKQIADLDEMLQKAARTSNYLEELSDQVMQTVADEHGLSPEMFPQGGYARALIEATSTDQMVSYLQALAASRDQAMLAFTEAYRTVHLLTSHPAVTVRVGVGELKTIPNQSKADELLGLLNRRDQARARHLAEGISAIRQAVENGTLDDGEVIAAMVSRLFREANAKASAVPLETPDEGEADAAQRQS